MCRMSKHVYNHMHYWGLHQFMQHVRRKDLSTAALFLDAGGVIELEHETHRRRSHGEAVSIGGFYQSLQATVPTIFVTEPVLQEVTNHHLHHRCNRRQEISGETLGYMSQFNSDYGDFCLRSRCARDLEQIGYDTYWASTLGFISDHKKSAIDPMSAVDRALVIASVAAQYSENFSEVFVLTSDRHVLRTIDVLTDTYNIRDHYRKRLEEIMPSSRAEEFLNTYIGEHTLFGYRNIFAMDVLDR